MRQSNDPSGNACVPKRAPDQVMRLSRMGSFHQTRLSFMRVLLRRMKAAGWTFDRPIWRIDEKGVGLATYRAKGPERTYTLVAFAHDLPADLRSDRVIAEAWDSTFTLFDGEPTEADLTRLADHVPVQEAGRLSDGEFVLSRANRSVRLFEHVVDALSRGEQPDPDVIEPVGYLMRTTAVYGSGKFGASDRDKWADRPEFLGSFQPELLSVWLIRSFTLDLAEHMAACRAPETAVTIRPDLRRRFGVGNSTGLGMAPFLLNHPALIHAWVDARETALARVRALETASAVEIESFLSLVKRAEINANSWHVDHPGQAAKCDGLRADFKALKDHLSETELSGLKPWDTLYLWAEASLSLEGQEQLVSLMLEPYGDLIDDLAGDMCADESGIARIDGTMSIAAMKATFSETYAWALPINFDATDAQARVWYVSEEKLEPRLGERFEEPLDAYEQPLAPGRDAMLALAALEAIPNTAIPSEEHSSLLKSPIPKFTTTRLPQICCLSTFCAVSYLSLARQNLIHAATAGCALQCFKEHHSLMN